MSILQEYEEAESYIGSEQYDAISIYLEKVCPQENVDKYYKGLNLVMQMPPEKWESEANKLRKEFNITLLSDVLYKKEYWDKFEKWFHEEYKQRNVKVLSVWESGFDDVRCNAVIYQNKKPIGNIIVNFESCVMNSLTNCDPKEVEQSFKNLIYCFFDKYSKLPKISKCSKLLQEIYDFVKESDSTMCHITDEDWQNFYADKYSEKDIEKLKQEIAEYKLDDIISLNEGEYKIVGYGNLETCFNDDRKLVKNKDLER